MLVEEIQFSFLILTFCTTFKGATFVVCYTSLCLHQGSHDYCDCECCIDGESVAEPFMNCFLIPTNWC